MIDLAVGAPNFGVVSAAAVPKDGDIVPVNATLNNPSGTDSGPVTAAFFAVAPGSVIGISVVSSSPTSPKAAMYPWRLTGTRLASMAMCR